MPRAPSPHPAVPARQSITDALHLTGYRPDGAGVWRPPPDITAWVDYRNPPPGWRYVLADGCVRGADRWEHTATGAVACAFRADARRTRQSASLILVAGAARLALRPVFDGSLPLISGAQPAGRRFPPDVRAAALEALVVGGTPAFDAVIEAFLG